MSLRVRRTALFAISTGAAVVAAFPAFAYVGPGAGLTLLGALWGLVVAVVVSVGFVLLWPIRRMMRRNKHPQPPADDDDATHTMLANSSGDPDDRRM